MTARLYQVPGIVPTDLHPHNTFLMQVLLGVSWGCVTNACKPGGLNTQKFTLHNFGTQESQVQISVRCPPSRAGGLENPPCLFQLLLAATFHGFHGPVPPNFFFWLFLHIAFSSSVWIFSSTSYKHTCHWIEGPTQVDLISRSLI